MAATTTDPLQVDRHRRGDHRLAGSIRGRDICRYGCAFVQASVSARRRTSVPVARTSGSRPPGRDATRRWRRDRLQVRRARPATARLIRRCRRSRSRRRATVADRAHRLVVRLAGRRRQVLVDECFEAFGVGDVVRRGCHAASVVASARTWLVRACGPHPVTGFVTNPVPERAHVARGIDNARSCIERATLSAHVDSDSSR